MDSRGLTFLRMRLAKKVDLSIIKVVLTDRFTRDRGRSATYAKHCPELDSASAHTSGGVDVVFFMAGFVPGGRVAESRDTVCDVTASVVQSPLQDPTPLSVVDFDSGESEIERKIPTTSRPWSRSPHFSPPSSSLNSPHALRLSSPCRPRAVPARSSPSCAAEPILGVFPCLGSRLALAAAFTTAAGPPVRPFPTVATPRPLPWWRLACGSGGVTPRG